LPNGHFVENRDNLLNFIGSLTRSKFMWLKSLSILMTETMIVKYNFVLYSFKFLTSLPKFRDIKNNIIQHHWWMRFPRKLHVNVFHMILQVKFAYVVVFVYSYFN
jgi:hypothetical protein